MKCLAKLRPGDPDTYDVHTEDGKIFLVFSLNREVVENEALCWMACVRHPGFELTSTRSFLEQAWPAVVANHPGAELVFEDQVQ